MKKYNKPLIEVLELKFEDIMTVSSGDTGVDQIFGFDDFFAEQLKTQGSSYQMSPFLFVYNSDFYQNLWIEKLKSQFFA